eukprot:scaffold29351_cov52-Attheya_sp.AAC.1
MILNKLSRGRIPPSAIVLSAFSYGLNYRQVMRRADTTAAVLKTITAVLVGLWLKRVLPL